jgi:phage tail protein X
MTVWRTTDGDMLDAICREHYGTEAQVAAVLEANRGLAALGPVYPAGVLITLPVIAVPAEAGQIRLWGRT